MRTTSDSAGNGCGNKIKHQSQDSADSAAQELTRQRGQLYIGYGPCHECKCYHVGQSRRGKKSKRR